jgi:hypothetical protein
MRVSIEFLHQLVERLEQATKANLQTPGRKGCLIQLGPESADGVMVAGDLHGNRVNFNKIVKAAALDAHPHRHLVLQEVVHGGPTYPNGGCMSHMLLEDVAALKVKYPDRVHFLLSNHEVAEVLKTPLMKGGVSQNQLFAAGLDYAYGAAGSRIAQGFHSFIRTCPLAIRLRNGVFISHSAPDQRSLPTFDLKNFTRELRDNDFEMGGFAYGMIWGRDHDPAHIKKFAELVKSTALVHGHEPTPAGWQTPNEYQLIFDGSGPECFTVLIPLDRKLTVKDLVASLVKHG